MTKGPLGYGRYGDDPAHVGCPRAKSDMTPCVARDGDTACADDGACVGCGGRPADLLEELVREVTGGPGAVPADLFDQVRRRWLLRQGHVLSLDWHHDLGGWAARVVDMAAGARWVQSASFHPTVAEALRQLLAKPEPPGSQP